jgi:hypothetical protein
MPATPDDAEAPVVEPSPEDAKLLTLARSARARTRAAEGAAVRDDMGRTYAAATVDLPSLRLSAIQAVVAAAVASGSDRLEAVAVVGDADVLDQADRAVLADLAVGTVILAAADGVPRPGRPR